MTSDTMNAIRKRKNRTFAIPAAAPARPVKPKIAAMIATMKNPIAQLSMTASKVEWDDWEACNSRAETGRGTTSEKRVLGRQCRRRRRFCAWRVALLIHHGRIERRLAVGREEAKLALVLPRDFAQRPKPIEEAREVRHPLGMRAKAGRDGIEVRSGLHARHAVRDQRQSTGNERSVHLVSPHL